jgi:UDP-glucose 4-epimerase
MFKGKTLLITGETGSFGNAVLGRFLNTDIKEIRIFSRDEKKQVEAVKTNVLGAENVLNAAINNKVIKKRDKVPLVGFGVGYSWDGTIITI